MNQINHFNPIVFIKKILCDKFYYIVPSNVDRIPMSTNCMVLADIVFSYRNLCIRVSSVVKYIASNRVYYVYQLHVNK